MSRALFCHKTYRPRQQIKRAVESLDGYLTKLASEAPVPGGGSAAMVVGAAGCALVSMVARICAGSPKYEAVKALAERLISQADALRERMLAAKARDEVAYEAVVAARGNKDAMQRALRAAAAVPFEGASDALTALRLAAQALDLGNANLVSDVGCAAEFAYSALFACAYNVRINHKFMNDRDTISAQSARLHRYEREANALLGGIRRAVNASLTRAR
jgi:formiminotetrahydrofolate cyclodeaminase